MENACDLVTQFLDKWDKPGGWRQAILDHFTSDAVYENVGMSRSEGLEAVLEFVDYFERVTAGGWMIAETRAIADCGSTVLTERIDHMVDGSGNIFMTTPVMGAFEIRDNKIAVWRDYFDTGGLDSPYDGPGSLMDLKR